MSIGGILEPSPCVKSAIVPSGKADGLEKKIRHISRVLALFFFRYSRWIVQRLEPHKNIPNDVIVHSRHIWGLMIRRRHVDSDRRETTRIDVG